MIITSGFPRRSLLQRLSLGAGAAVLSPFVRSQEAQAAGASLSRKRLLMVTFCNGMEYRSFAPPEFQGKATFSQELVNTSTFTWPDEVTITFPDLMSR